MAITPPKWAKNAVPTLRGWCHPKTGELLKSQSISQYEIDEWYNVGLDVAEPVVEEVTVFAPAVNLSAMTKAQLVEYAANAGIEVDPKLTKPVIIETIENA